VTGVSIANGARVAAVVAVTVFVPIGLMVAGETSLPPFDHLDVALRLLMALPVAVVVAGLEGALLWPVVRNHPSGALAGIYLAIYSPVVAFMLVGLANVALDRSPVTEHEARVVRYEHPRKGNGAMIVTSWRTPGGEEKIPILVSESTAPPGSIVRVATHPGALGLAWVTAVRAR
jgi:hypothetical protein